MFRPVSKWFYCLLSIVAAMGCGNMLHAQQTEPSPSHLPYAAQITGDQVNIRSGPAQVYYPVTTLNKGQRVRVVKEMFGWAKIEPTKGSFSYIAKEFVDRPDQPGQGDAQATVAAELFDGIVNANNVRVRAGSIKVPPAHADEVQTKLKQGAIVKVIGRRDDYYKILSPQHCYFWVSLKFIKPAEPIAQEVVEVPATENPPASVQDIPTQTQVDSEPVASQKATEGKTPLSQEELDRQAYQQIVDSLEAQLHKSMITRDFSSILLQVTGLIDQTSSSSSSTKVSLKRLERHVKRADLALRIWKRSQQQDEQFKMTLAAIDSKIAEAVAIHAPPAKREKDIVVQGRLTNSAVFTANNKNRRFLVLDEQDRITYYAISIKEGIDLASWVGRDVSLVGQATYDTFSKTRLLHVISVVKLPQ